MKKRILMVLGGATLAAALAIPAVVGADSGDRPPKAAIDKMNKSLTNPSADGGGIVDPAKDTGAALVLRDAATGLVLRDPATGLPQVLRDEKGNVKQVRAQEVPGEQRMAQAKNDERAKRAGDGDVQAQNELRDEATKTREAVKKHAPNAANVVPPNVSLPAPAR